MHVIYGWTKKVHVWKSVEHYGWVAFNMNCVVHTIPRLTSAKGELRCNSPSNYCNYFQTTNNFLFMRNAQQTLYENSSPFAIKRNYNYLLFTTNEFIFHQRVSVTVGECIEEKKRKSLAHILTGMKQFVGIASFHGISREWFAASWRSCHFAFSFWRTAYYSVLKHF